MDNYHLYMCLFCVFQCNKVNLLQCVTPKQQLLKVPQVFVLSCLSCKWSRRWFCCWTENALKPGNNRAEGGEKASDTRRVLSFKSVTQADGATWEISFGRGLHGLDPICRAPSGPTANPRALDVHRGDRRAPQRSAWIAYGGVPFKTPKQFPSESLFWKPFCATSPTMQFLTCDTGEPAVTCDGG